MISRELFEACVLEANLAPSVHNVQPARWALRSGGRLSLACDAGTALPVADPDATDLLFSCGTALEGMVMALRHRGFSCTVVPAPEPGPGGALAELLCEPAAACSDPLRAFVETRRTCRSGFAPVPADTIAELDRLVGEQDDLHLIRAADRIAEWAGINDRLSVDVFRDPAFRREMLSWMRLSPKHPSWARDGLNAEALNLSALEAWVVPLAFSRPVFGALDAIGLSAGLVAEAEKTRQAHGILCLSVPDGQSELENGRRYYRVTLELAAMGLATWPMAVLIDTATARHRLEAELGVAETHRLRNCLRIGVPSGKAPMRARHPIGRLLRG